MILRGNLQSLREICAASERVLDVGGWHNPFNLATHVIDLMPYDTRRGFDALDPEDAERFTAETWHIQDICDGTWPWPDDYFDFSICSHTLEDVRDPLPVCRELVRVSKAGYIEVPSRTREIYCKSRFSRARALAGGFPEVGFPHHRWFCEIDDGHVRFLRKSLQSIERRAFYITRGELGRKLTEAESGACLFWEESFSAEEVFDVPDDALAAFKAEALAELRGGKPPAWSSFGAAMLRVFALPRRQPSEGA